MKVKSIVAAAVIAVVFAWFAGLKAGERRAGGAAGLFDVAAGSRVVARFAGGAVTLEDLAKALEGQGPLAKARAATEAGRHELLSNLVRFELLAREAVERGYHRDPDVRRQLKRNLVAVFVQREFDQKHEAQPIAEEALRRYYDDHREDYQKPERVRVAHLLVASPDDAASRAARRKLADGLIAEVRKRALSEPHAFRAVAGERSDDALSRPAGGDLRFQTRAELSERLGPAVAEAAFAARTVGAVLPPIETARGFELVQLLGREDGVDLAFEQVRDPIRTRLLQERRSEAYQKFIAGLEREAGLEIDEKALAAFEVTGGKPLAPRPPKAPAENPGAGQAPSPEGGADGEGGGRGASAPATAPTAPSPAPTAPSPAPATR